MSKKYFSADFLSFFEELTASNTKEWFDLNRKTYEKEVKAPFKHFVEDLITKIQAYDPRLSTTASASIFRINRDIRFSKEKHPYKLQVSAAISSGGKKSHLPGYYLELSNRGVTVGGGAYFLEKEHLAKVRMEIAYELEEFSKIISESAFVNAYGQVKGEKNKKLSSELKEALHQQPLIANKQFYYMANLDASLVTSADLLEKIDEHFKLGFPLNQFLRRALEE